MDLSYLPNGTYVVTIDDGITSAVQQISPDMVPIQGAFAKLKNELASYLVRLMAPKYRCTPTPEQQEAWEALYRLYNGNFWLYTESPSSVIEGLAEIVFRRTQESYDNEFVRELASQYQMAIQLTWQQEKQSER